MFRDRLAEYGAYDEQNPRWRIVWKVGLSLRSHENICTLLHCASYFDDCTSSVERKHTRELLIGYVPKAENRNSFFLPAIDQLLLKHGGLDMWASDLMSISPDPEYLTLILKHAKSNVNCSPALRSTLFESYGAITSQFIFSVQQTTRSLQFMMFKWVDVLILLNRLDLAVNVFPKILDISYADCHEQSIDMEQHYVHSFIKISELIGHFGWHPRFSEPFLHQFRSKQKLRIVHFMRAMLCDSDKPILVRQRVAKHIVHLARVVGTSKSISSSRFAILKLILNVTMKFYF